MPGKGPAVGKQLQPFTEKRAVDNFQKSLKIKLSITSQLCLPSFPPPHKLTLFLSSLEGSYSRIGNAFYQINTTSVIFYKNKSGHFLASATRDTDKGWVLGRFF